MIVPTSYNVSHVADIEWKGGGASNIKQYREVSDLVCPSEWFCSPLWDGAIDGEILPPSEGGGGLSRISKCLCDRVWGFNSSLVSLAIDHSRSMSTQ